MKKRWILCTLFVLAAVLAGCMAAEQPPPDGTGGETTSSAQTDAVTTGEFDPGLPAVDFGGADFTVLHYDQSRSRYFITVDEDKLGDALGAAAHDRNLKIEETYKVKIQEANGAGNQIRQALSDAVLAGDGIYDAVIPQSGEGYASMITSNLVRDLRGVERIDLTRKWWYPDALENMCIAGHVYFTSSYYTVTCQNFFGLLYNKELVENLGLTSPTELALDGAWTLDEMQTMMAAATNDLDGNGTMDGNDRYGLITCPNIMYPFMTGFGQISVGKDADGKPTLVLNNDAVVGAVDRMNRIVAGGDLFFGTYENQSYIIDNFSSGRALFALFGLGAYYNTLRSVEADFGILPLPKLNADQQKYYTLRADSFLGIPSIVKDIEKSGTVLEALSAASMETVYPAFKDVVLYSRSLRDEASARVLDLFYDSTVYDIGMTYCADRTLARLLDQYKSQTEIRFASLYASKSGAIQKQLDTLYTYIVETDGVVDEALAGSLPAQTQKQEKETIDMKKIDTEKFDISRTDTIMEGWPDLIRTASGKLICVYNECVAHGNRDHSRIALRESSDDGKTWSDARYVDIETFQGDQWNSIRLSQFADGRLILVCDRIDGNEKTDTTEIWMWESTDDGVSWSEGIRHGIFGYCADKVRELKDGTLLLLVSSYDSGLRRSVIYAHRSTDGGKTWSERIPVASDPEYSVIEPAVLETSDGTLVAFLRENSSKNYDCMRAISKDGGKTWEGMYPLALPGCHRPFVGYLSDGRILLTYRSYIDKTKRVVAAAVFDEAAALSKDRGTIPLFQLDYDSAASPDTGYTAWVELADKEIIMANYIVDTAPRAFIRGYRFSADDFK